jgi:hypothetical protein
MAKTTKPVVTPKAAPARITFEVELDAVIYTDKNGAGITAREALSFFKSPAEALGYAGSRKRTLAQDRVRKVSGQPASRLYVNGNLPAEASDLAAQFRATMAALVPAMAPKAPSAPKAAPVAPLDLSDPLEAAVSQELASEPPKAAPKARKPKAAPQDTKAAPVPTVVPEVVPEAPKAATVAPVQATPPVVRSLSGIPADRMAALKAKDAARRAARKAAQAS